MANKVKFNSYTQQPKDPVSWEIKQAAAERWEWQHCLYGSDEGCRLIRKIATSRSFNRYRSLYTMPALEDMVQEAFIGMLAYKDDFTGEPGEVIFKAIRKYFKIKYREANGAGRDFDNGRHNARIQPKAKKPPKLLIDELDYDPAKEPESVKKANNIKNWRIGGITIMNRQKRLEYEYIDNDQWEGLDKGVIHYFDEIKAPQGCVITIHDIFKETTKDDWIYKTSDGWSCGNYLITPVINDNGIEKEIFYRRRQTKTADYKLKIETVKDFTKKRDNPLELVSLLHAGFYPEVEQVARGKKIFFPPGAKGPLTAAPALQQFFIEHCRQPADQKFKDSFFYYSNTARRGALILILKETLALINTMPQPQGLIMKLYYYQGLTQGDICATLHKSTRKVQLAREAGLETIKQYYNCNYPLTDIEKILSRVRKQILKGEILPL